MAAAAVALLTDSLGTFFADAGSLYTVRKCQPAAVATPTQQLDRCPLFTTFP